MKNINTLRGPIQAVFVVLFAVLIFVLVISFLDIAPMSIKNIDNKENYVGGESQSFRILLKTVDPEQFRTDMHYREQYGRWRIESLNGTILSSGKITKIEKGIYDSYLTIRIPDEPSKLIADIVEYQYSIPIGSENNTYFMDDGTTKINQEIALNLLPCAVDLDCLNKANICSTQTATCNLGSCVLEGQCSICEVDATCGPNERCINKQCVKIQEQSFFTEISQSIAQPISQSGYSVDGTPAPEIAPRFLIIAVLIVIAINIFLILQVQKSGKRIFGRRI